MLSEIRHSFRETLAEATTKNPWTNVYGLARSIIALGLLLTIVTTSNEGLFALLGKGGGTQGVIVWVDNINFFKLLSNHLVVARYLSCLILLLVISGYLPQITGILHWWIAMSFTLSSPLIEGGDQLNAIIAFLLLPVAISDNRFNHWYAPKQSKSENVKLIAWSCFLIIVMQVSLVYYHASIAKFSVEEWINGTAVYYWATHNVYGVNESLRDFFMVIFSNKFIIVFFTWGTLCTEIILASWIWMKRNSWNWKLLFSIGVLFHFMIIIFHGLASFFFSMLGALILYLFPKDKPIKLWWRSR